MLQAILALPDWQQKQPRGHRLPVSLEDVRTQPLHLRRNCSRKCKQCELQSSHVLSFVAVLQQIMDRNKRPRALGRSALAPLQLRSRLQLGIEPLRGGIERAPALRSVSPPCLCQGSIHPTDAWAKDSQLGVGIPSEMLPQLQPPRKLSVCHWFTLSCTNLN